MENLGQLGQYLGAGLACVGMAGAAMGVGNVAGNYLAGALRNPSAAASQTATLFIGMAFAEALAHGLPIVATDVPGNCELVLEGRNGKRAALDDPHALARAITALLTDHALYAHSSACALEQADDYTIGKAAERHLALYARATGNGG